MILPVVVNGFLMEQRHFQTTVRVVNLGDTVTVSFEAFQNDGTPTRLFGLYPIAQPGTVSEFEIPRFGSVDVATEGDVPDFDGWARVTFPAGSSIEASAEVALIDGPIGPKPICHRPPDEIVAKALVPAQPAGNFVSAFVASRAHRQSAVALVNPWPQPVSFYWSMLDLGGGLVASGPVEIPPSGRVALSVKAMAGSATQEFTGSFRVSTDVPLAAGVIHLLSPQLRFASASASSLNLACLTVLTPARNPITGECVVFNSSCIPAGWEAVEGCE